MRGWKAFIAGIIVAFLAFLGAAVAQAQTLEQFAVPAPSEPIGEPATAAPEAPTNLQAHADSNTQITITWQDNSSDEDEFRIEVHTNGNSFSDIGGVPANVTTVHVFSLVPGTTYFFRVRARNSVGDSPYSNEASATTLNGSGSCIATATAMCLNNNRFRVEANFQTSQGQSGAAQMVKLTSDSGYMWFFASSNIEVVVKVLDGCGTNNHYWFFAGGLTNVRVVLTVTDTQFGLSQRYVNFQSTPFQPIQDINAFATCP